MNKCPGCGTDLIENSIYCAECGLNLKISSYSESVKSIPEISKNYLDTYVQLSNTLDTYEGIEADLNQHKAHTNELRNQRTQIDSHLLTLKNQRLKEQKDFEDLKNLTWTSLGARIKGDRKERLEKEEAEYLDALAKEQDVQTNLDEIDKRLNLATNQENQLMNQFQAKIDLENKIKDLINKACEGVSDPIEDKLENQLNDLMGQRKPFQARKKLLASTLNYLQNANYNYNQALRILKDAHGLSTWDLFGGGLMVDSMKHSKVGQAKNYASSGNRELYTAYNMIKELPQISTPHIQQTSFLGDGIFDNFFSDMNARAKIESAQEDVRSTIHEVNNLINWINNQITMVTNQDNNLISQEHQLRDQLFEERKRMIKDALSSKKAMD